jgi:hypothetical protein
MADYTGKAQFFVALKVPAQHEAEADRFFEHHADLMQRTHPKVGEEALLQYTVCKNPDEDGSVLFLSAQVYETKAGIDNHRKLIHEEPGLYEDLVSLVEKCDTTIGFGDSQVVHSLW